MEIQFGFETGSRRSLLQIYSEVLASCEQPASRFQVMQASYTSFGAVLGYLLELQRLGLLEAVDEGRKYVITERGHVFLEKWHGLAELLFPEEGGLKRFNSVGLRRSVWSGVKLKGCR